jgi:hypothetical protein
MQRLEFVFIGLLVFVGTGCPKRLDGGLAGLDCAAKTGLCVPRDGGSPTADAQDSGPSDGGADGPSVDIIADVGAADAGDADGGGDGSTGATIQIVSPASPAYTNGSISIQVSVLPESAVAEVDLFDGDVTIATIGAPFSYMWGTSGVVEGPHQVTARATVGGRIITSPPITINVDRTPPQVFTRLPDAGATQVLFADPMQIVFSEAIAPATIQGAITLSTGAGPVAITSALGTDGKTVSISISDRHAVALPANIAVSLKPTIADLAGNQIGTTASWSWTAPSWVKLPVLSGKYPALAMGTNDQPVVLTAVEQGATGSNTFVLQVAQLGATRSWDTSAGSPQGTGLVSYGGSLLVGSDAHPVVAWSEAQASSPATIHVAKWTGTSWDKSFGELDAVSGAGTDGRNPFLALSTPSDLFVAWAENNPTSPTVFVAKWGGTSWDMSYGNVGAIGANEPVLRFGMDGQPIVAYTGDLNDNDVSRWDGSKWSMLPPYQDYIQAPTLAVDAMDRPVVTSMSGQSSDQYIHLNFWSTTANAWVEEIPVIPTGLSPSQALLVLPADGHPVVTWTDYDTTAGARVVKVARHTGVQWDFTYGSLDAVSGMNTDGSSPRIALDRGGSPIVTWQETDGTLLSTYVWRSNH